MDGSRIIASVVTTILLDDDDSPRTYDPNDYNKNGSIALASNQTLILPDDKDAALSYLQDLITLCKRQITSIEAYNKPDTTTE